MTAFWYYHQGSVAVGAVGVGVSPGVSLGASPVVGGVDVSPVVGWIGVSPVVGWTGVSLGASAVVSAGVSLGASAVVSLGVSAGVSVGASLGAAVVAGSW